MQNQIPKNWQKVKLGEVLDMKYGSGLPEKNRTTGQIPVYGSSGIVGYHSKAFVNKPGLVIGRKGVVGSVYYSEEPFYPIDTVYFVDDLKIPGDLKFFYYFLKRVPLERIGSHSGVPGLNRDLAYGLDINIPDEEEQKQIASILSAFDDKIEVNNKIAKTLEEMAQALFKEWFSKGEGKEYSLLDVANFINGGAFGRIINKNKKGLPLIKIAELNRSITENTEWIDRKVDDKYNIKDGDLLFSWSGTVDLFIWYRGTEILNQHIFNVIPKNNFPLGFLYFLLKSKIRIFKHTAGAKATTMGHIKKEHLKDKKIFISRDKDLKIFDDIYRKIKSLMLENQKLAALRDLLLPKLMKGEIRI